MVATSWAAEKRQHQHGRTGQVPGRRGWRALILAGLVGLTFARWLWILDDHRAVVALAPDDPPPVWRHLAAPANLASIATVGLIGAALPGLAVGTQHPLDALWSAAQGFLALAVLVVAFAVMVNRFSATTSGRHAAARARIEQQAPGAIAVVSNAASRGAGRGEALWDPLFAEAASRYDTLLLQTSGDSLIRYWANQGFAVADRVPTPAGDRALMVRWPADPRSHRPEVSTRREGGPTSRGGRRGGTGG